MPPPGWPRPAGQGLTSAGARWMTHAAAQGSPEPRLAASPGGAPAPFGACAPCAPPMHRASAGEATSDGRCAADGQSAMTTTGPGDAGSITCSMRALT